MTDYLRLARESAPTPAAPAPAADNPYLGMIQADAQAQQARARTVLELALKDDPEIAAERQRLSVTSGVPLRVVERNLDELRIKERARMVDLARMAQESPVLYRQLVDPTFTTVAQDDLPVLTQIERAINGAFRYATSGDMNRSLAGDTVRASQDVLAGATMGLGEGILNLTGALYDLVGWDSGARDMRYYANRSREARQQFGLQPESSTGQDVKAGLGSAGTNLALLPAGLLRGLFQTAEAASVAVAGAQGAMVGADAYFQGREARLGKGQSTVFGLTQGGFEFLFEKIPAQKLFGDIALNETFVRTLGKQLGIESVTEQATTLAQDFNEWMNLNPEKSVGQFLAERPEAAYQTFIATLVGVGVQTSTIQGINKIVEKMSDQALVFEQDRFDEMMKAAGQSMLRQRSPEQFRAHVQRVLDEGADSGASKEVYVDAEVLAQLPPDVLAQLPARVQEQIPAALEAGSTVAIPMADVLTVAPGTALEQTLNDFARLRPDAPTRAEAQQAADVLKQDAERILQQAQDQAAAQQEFDAVRMDLAQQIAAAGRYRPAVAEAYAAGLAHFFVAYGARTGLGTKGLYEAYKSRGFAIRGQASTQGAALEAGKPGEISVVGYHFSTQDRPVLSTAFYGTGLKGSARDQIMSSPDARLRQRLSFYFDKGTGVRPESGVGGRAHRVSLTGVYDADADPLKLRTADARTFESKLLDLGYRGYATRMEGTQPGQVIMLGQQTFQPELLGGQTNITSDQVLAPIAREPQWQTQASGTPEQLQARLERMQANPAWRNYEFRIEGGELQVRELAGVLEQSLSSRLPGGRKATEDPLADTLVISWDVALRDPETLAKNVAAMQAYPNFQKLTGKGAKSTERNAEAIIKHMVDNLLWLHDHMPAEMRDRARLWYDGARKTVEVWAERYGISEMQGAAAIAVLSPQNGWFANVSQAERIADLVFGGRDIAWTDAMTAEALRISPTGVLDEAMLAAQGKTLGELLDRPEIAARWLRVYDQTHNSRAYRVLTPEGGAADFVKTGAGNDAAMMWKFYSTIAKAVSVLMDGRAENVHYQIGKEHKVRNFYNNIFAPKSVLGYATIDTHAVAAALLRPLGSADVEVGQAFGGTGTSSSLATGLNGTYPIYWEAYRRAAEERGLLPREMQSIAWEAVRGLFEAAQKKSLKADANAIWERFRKGEITHRQAQKEILALAGDITPPSWTTVPFNDQPGRTYEGPAQAAVDARETPGAEGALTSAIMFEVAPDPNDKALIAEWNALPHEDQLRISQQVAARVVPEVLRELGTDGDLTLQLGGYMGATNPSMTLRVARPELALTAAKLLGHALSQDSMMVVTDTPVVGADPVGVVTVALPEGYGEAQVSALYDRLWELEHGGEKLVGGHTTADGMMTILNYSPLSSEDLARMIDAHLGGAFDIAVDEVYSAFPSKETYGYASDRQPERDAASRKAPAARRPDRLRSEAARLLREALDARAQQEGLTDEQPQPTRDRGGRQAGLGAAPLPGAPSVEGATGPDPRLVAVAEQYALENGIDLKRQGAYVEVDEDRARRIAAAYAEMEHAPDDPRVKEAYDDLMHQTLAQYLALQRAGYQFYFIDPNSDPYAGNPWNAMRDLRANQRMGVFPTTAGFGSAEQNPFPGNPLEQDSGLEWPDQYGQMRPVLFNDLFRAVHDAFGHGLEGAGFRAQGEENAWQAHVRLFTGPAVGAITSETRGQNSWLNYGPHGEANQTAKVEDTVFADQKTGLMPSWTWGEGRAPDADSGVLEQRAADVTETEAFKRWSGDSVAVTEVNTETGQPVVSSREPKRIVPTVMYHTTRNSFDTFEIGRPTVNSGTFGDVETTRAAIFVTPELDASQAYGTAGGGFAAGANVMPLYVKAENPLDLTSGITFEIEDQLVSAGLSPSWVAHRLGNWDNFDDEDGKTFVAAVKSLGYDSVIFNDQNPDTGDSFEAWALFSPEQIKSAIGNDGSFDANDPSILSQGPRGTFSPSTLELVLNPDADLSTLWHEMGHFFLEVLADVAAQPNAPAQIAADWQTVLKHFGVTDEQWRGFKLDDKRNYHEQWARAVEAYVMEGKVPNAELAPLMRRFASWLKSVYGSIKAFLAGLPVGQRPEINEDIRRVMDRMLATDEQIAQANEVAGLTPDEQADAEAQERLRKRSMADLKWTVKARDKVIRELQKKAASIRKEIEAEVTVEANQTPEMRAKAALDALQITPEYQGILDTWKAERETAAADERARLVAELYAANPDAVGLKKGQLLAKNKREIANKVDAFLIGWDRANPKPARPVNMNDADMATVADSFGYPSVEAMLEAIANFGSKQDYIDGRTEQRMLEEHGDLMNEEAIKEAANEAVHNEARARSLASELRSQAEMLNTRTDTGETNAKGSKVTVSSLMLAAKQFGENVVGRTTLRDLKSVIWQHTAAERRAAKKWQEATAAGKTEEAVRAKQDQVLNNAAARAALDAKAEGEKMLAFFARVLKGNDETVVEKGRDPDIVNAARAVLQLYGLQSPASKGAAAYLEALRRNDPDTWASVEPMAAAASANAQPVLSLTFDELVGLHEQIQAMWFLAKRSRQMEVGGDLMDIDDLADDLLDRLEEIGIPDRIPGEGGAVTKAEERGLFLKQGIAFLRRVEQWAEGIDGKYGGPFLRYVFQPVKDAADRYRKDRIAYRKQFQALVDKLSPIVGNSVIDAPELGYTFGAPGSSAGTAMNEILHALLHTGNESNKRKMLVGRGWAVEGPNGELDTSKWDAFIARLVNEGKLEKGHYDFLQGVWDLMESTKPLAQKTHRDVFGRYFAEVTAEPFVDPFGIPRSGGYVPAQVDPRLVKDNVLKKLAEEENNSMAFAFPQPAKGFTMSRVEGYNRPLMLDLRTLSQHLDKVLLFAHMTPATRGVRKLITHKKVGGNLDRVQPAAIETMLQPWLQRSAQQIVETPVVGAGKWARIPGVIRARAGMALMFASVSNTLQQITGLSTAAVRVKPAHLMRALAQYVAAPREFSKTVWDLSPYMDDRATNEVAIMNEQMQDILIRPGVYQRAQSWSMRHAYFLQTAFDNVLSPIVWTGAYNQALAEGMSDVDAIKFADGTVRQTQGSTLPEDVSRLETGPAYARVFTQFVGYFNMMANTNGTALKQIADEVGLKKGAGKAFYVVLMGLMVPIWVAEAIAQAFKGGPDDEDKDGQLVDDWLAAVFGFGTAKGLLAQVPIAGQVAVAGMNRMNGNPLDDRISLSPAVSLLEASVGAPESVYKAIAEDGSKQKAIRDVATLVSVATGIPVYAAARPLGYAAGVADNRIDPTSPVDLTRGLVTGTASPESKQR